METLTDLEKRKLEEKDAVSIKYGNMISAEHKKIDEKYQHLINRSMDGGKARRPSLQFVKREAGLDPIEVLPLKKNRADMVDTPDNLPGTSTNVTRDVDGPSISAMRQNAIGDIATNIKKTTNIKPQINLENQNPVSKFFIKDILDPSKK